MWRRMPCRPRLARNTPITCGAPNGWCRLFINCSHAPAGRSRFSKLRDRRRTAPWLVSSLVSLNLFEPRIAKRFEAGAEVDRAVAQVLKLGCRLVPPSYLWLLKWNLIQPKFYLTKTS